MSCWSVPTLARVVGALSVIAGGLTQRAMTQTATPSTADHDRGPRFFVAMAGRTSQVDVQQIAELRRRVTTDLVDVPLSQALREIAAKAALRLAYSPDIVRLDRRVSLQVRNITVAAALMEVLVDERVDIVLSARNQLGLVRQGKAASSERWATGSLVGVVTDTAGAKLFGVEVFLEGTRWKTMTDTAGRYAIADVDSGSYVLTARRPGYQKQSHSIRVHAGQEDVVNFVLQPVAVGLNELVTTATGPQRRRDLGNSITTIRADSVMQTAPIRNLTDLLENRVPGLTVQRTSGAPGDPARLRLRGFGSINQNNDPIVFVDGARVYSAQSGDRSGNLTNLAGSVETRFGAKLPAPSPLDQIDPNTIEKVEIFKGPSAATLYGADAANGVIVITTKRGRPGPTTWSASYSHGFSKIPGRYPEAYFRFGHVEELANITVICPVIEVRCQQDSLVRFQMLNDPDLTIFDQGRTNAFSLTASGGNQALTFRLTTTYGTETGVLKLPAYEAELFRAQFTREAPDWMRRPHNLEKWSVSSNVTARLNATVDVTLAAFLERTEQQRSSLEERIPKLAGAYLERLSGNYYFPIGSGPTSSSYGGPGGFYSVMGVSSDILTDYYTKATASSFNFLTRLTANWRPNSWLSMTSQASLNINPRDDTRLLPTGLVAPTDSGGFIHGMGQVLISGFNFQTGIRKPLGMGFTFQADLGANLTTKHINDLVGQATGLVPGTGSLNQARVNGASERIESSSVFGWYIEPRIVGQRISFSTGIRLDGGSSYGTRVTSLLGLPKLQGSWVISEEPWFPFSRLFSSLRLRGAYGQAQVQPGVTDRLRLYSQPFEGAGQWLDLSAVGNTQLRPERSVEVEGGIDADLFDARVTLELTGYVKNQVDALMSSALPPSVNGGGNVIMNIGNVRNRGVEATVGVTPIRSSLITWNTQLNFARNTNILVKLGTGVTPNPRAGLVEGYPLYGRWARPIIGIADANGDGVIERGEIQLGDDFMYMGRLQPASVSSLHNNFAFFGGALSLSASFAYDAGAMQVDQTAKTNWVLARGLADPNASFFEQAAALSLDSTDYGLTQNVSTFRFNSVAMNYRAPSRIAKMIGAAEMTIGVQGYNLALNSTYRGKDPNVMAWSAGETIVDTGQLPTPRRWQLMMRLTY